MPTTFEVKDIFLVPLHTAAGMRYHFKFSTAGFGLNPNDRIAIPVIKFFKGGEAEAFAYFLPQEEFILGPDGRIELEFMAVPRDPQFDPGDSPLLNVRAEIQFSGPGEIGDPQPLGNLKPVPLASRYFATTGRHEPSGSTGRYRYTFNLTVFDENGTPITFVCTGVKDFNGDPEILCGTEATQITPGNAAFVDHKTYPDNVGSGAITWTASTSSVNNCP